MKPRGIFCEGCNAGLVFALLTTLIWAGTGGDTGRWADALIPTALGLASFTSIAIFYPSFRLLTTIRVFRLSIAALWCFALWMALSIAWSESTADPEP
jgi:hypothetical protein